jgi:hypothetical protein
MVVIKTVILLEDALSIQSVIKDSNHISGEKVFIPLSSGALYAFEQQKVTYRPLNDYGGGDERYQEGLKNFQRFDRLVTILDKELAHYHDIPTLKPARYSIFDLKMLLDVLWTKIHILKTIIEREHPDSVRLYTSYPTKSDSGIYDFSNDESVYAAVLNMPGWLVPVEIIQGDHIDSIESHRWKAIYNKSIRFFMRVIFFSDMRRVIYRIGIAGREFYCIVTCWNRKPVLIFHAGYNWDDSLVELYRAGFCPVYRAINKISDRLDNRTPDYCEGVSQVCSLHPSLREFDHILGIDVSVFFFNHVSYIIGNSIRESIISYNKTRKKIRQKKIRCLLLSIRDRAIGHAIVQAARDAGIPVVSWQHGGWGYCDAPMALFVEFINSDYHFVFGNGVAESGCKNAVKFDYQQVPVFVPVGSSSLDNFWKGSKKTSITAYKPIVYITTHYIQNIYLISHPFDPIGWNEHLWSIQKRVMDLAREVPQREFIIKLHPLHNDKEPLISYVKDHQISNVTLINSEVSVRKLTDIADIIIFDLISTGILQVLTSDNPVFVYSGLHVIDPEPILTLKKRAYVSQNPEEFIYYIKEYIRSRKVNDYPIDTTNSEFLMRYGTDIHTHHSAGNAVAKLNEILSATR